MWRSLPRFVTLRDVTLRDGLQSEGMAVPLEAKLALVRSLLEAGVREMEVAAFVHPEKVPAMADADRLWPLLPKDGRGVFSALVFNRKGLERALRAGVERIAVFVSASEAHSRRNTGRGFLAALREAEAVLVEARDRGMKILCGVMSAFGCTLEGAIPADRFRDLVRALAAPGPEEMTLADTSGTGNPLLVARRVEVCRALVGEMRIGLHLHDAMGWALANMTVALQLGVDLFDVTLEGLGGCPFLPGAPGNLPAGRVLRFLSALGIRTGIDPAGIEEAGRRLGGVLGRRSFSPGSPDGT